MGILDSLWSNSRALEPINTTRLLGNGDGEGEPLSPAARLYHEPDFNVYIIVEVGCAVKINVDVVMQNLSHTLLRHPRFSSLQVTDASGTMKWVPTRVDLNRHVIIPELNSDQSSADGTVEDYVSDLSTTSINGQDRPMWDLHLLNIETSKAAAVAVFRIHHSLGDGMSLMSLLLACTRKAADSSSLPTIPVAAEWKRETIAAKGFWWTTRLILNTIVDVLLFIATTLFLKDTDTPIKGLPRLGSSRWRFVHRTVSFDDIKFVRKALNATVNDVMMGITLAALSRYLNKKYGEKKNVRDNVQEKKHIPSNIRLRAALLVNTRPSLGIHAFAEMMEKGAHARWGNHVGFVLLPFPVDIYDDPLQYVSIAKGIVNRKKHSLEAIATCFITEAMFKVFGTKIAGFLAHRAPALTTMSFSNLVGPIEEISFYGHRMTYLSPCCYGQSHALMINCQSYANQMTFVLSVDDKTIPDPHYICDEIEECLRDIKETVKARYPYI